MKPEESLTDLPSEREIPVTDNSQKYPALRIVSTFLSIIGWLLIVAGAVFFFTLQSSGEAVFSFLAIIAGLILSLPLFALSNLIYVVIDIEYNTRRAANLE